MFRIFESFIAGVGILILSPLFLLLYVRGWLEFGDPLFRQQRIGKDKRPFTIYKFRTLKLDTPEIATHFLTNQDSTAYGIMLRRNKLDELPQLWNVLIGNMSFVGPRPCLSNQIELIIRREKLSVFRGRPGITGLAQINGIDMSDPETLARTDADMLNSLGLTNYFKYIFITLFGRRLGDTLESKNRQSAKDEAQD